jgi:hypothetical protein
MQSAFFIAIARQNLIDEVHTIWNKKPTMTIEEVVKRKCKGQKMAKHVYSLIYVILLIIEMKLLSPFAPHTLSLIVEA